MKFFWGFLAYWYFAEAQRCSFNAPSLKGRFSEAQLQWMCEEKLRFERLKQGDPNDPGRPAQLTIGQKSYLNFVQNCKKGACLVRYHSDKEEIETAGDPQTDKRCQLNNRSSRPKFCDPANHPACRNPSKPKPKFCRRPPRNPRQSGNLFRVVRKEYRMLTDAERNQFHSAVNKLKSSQIDGLSRWDILITSHYPEKAPGAHWGPAFLPWHREFLRQVEIALRNEDSSVAIPYWDSTLDSELPDPKDSLLWSEEFLGNGDAFVTSGPFAQWPTATELPGNPSITKLYRDIGKVPLGDLMKPKDVEFVRQQHRFANLTACVDPTFELTHGLPHIWVGGFMGVIRVSPNDPVFFLHHSFVDSLWEQFRQQQQSQPERVGDWADPNQQCDPNHSLQADMKPFQNLKNVDGLSERYTREFYHYEPSPSCAATGDCGSKYLFCHLSRCRSKIRIGGNCRNSVSGICYNSVCVNNVCVQSNEIPQTASTTGDTTVTATVKTSLQTTSIITSVPTVTQETKLLTTKGQQQTTVSLSTNHVEPITFSTETDGTEVFIQTILVNQNGVVTDGIVTTSQQSSKPVKLPEFPEYIGLVYVPVRLQPDTTTLALKASHNGQSCQPICFSLKSAKFTKCSGQIVLSQDPQRSDPIAFSADLEVRKYLNCDLSQHPSRWKRLPPTVTFLCDGAEDVQLIRDAVALPKLTLDTNSPHVWFHVLVVSRTTPFDQSVPGATIVAKGLSYIDSYRVSVPSGTEFPNYEGVAHVKAKNPGLGAVNLLVEAYDPQGRKCLTLCKGEQPGTYRPCSGVVTLSGDPQKSDLFPYTNVERMKSFAEWNLTGHPKLWTRLISLMEFGC